MYNQSHDCWCITVSQRLRPFIAVNRSYASSSSPRSETLGLTSNMLFFFIPSRELHLQRRAGTGRVHIANSSDNQICSVVYDPTKSRISQSNRRKHCLCWIQTNGNIRLMRRAHTTNPVAQKTYRSVESAGAGIGKTIGNSWSRRETVCRHSRYVSGIIQPNGNLQTPEKAT